MVYEGALADLRRQGGAGYRLRTTDDERALALLRRSPASSTRHAGEHGLELPGPGARRRRAVARARRAPASAILALTPELATLEDLFFRLTEGRDGGPATGAVNGNGAAAPRGRHGATRPAGRPRERDRRRAGPSPRPARTRAGGPRR